MKILFIPDLHMLSAIVLPEVEKILQLELIDQIVFMGDYFDQ